MAEDELLDYCNHGGARLGTATRREVHAAGLWHRTLHLWLARGDGALLYQLRSARAANWPGLLDVSVAGHLLAGESYADAFREAEEEIGIAVPAAAVIPLGIRRDESEDGIGRNRELQGVHLALLDPAWGEFFPADGEADGLFAVAAGDGRRLHRGEVDAIVCDALIADAGAIRRERRVVALADLVPRDDDYYLRVHDLAERLARGEPLAIDDGFAG